VKAGLSLLEKWITDVTEEVSINFCSSRKNISWRWRFMSDFFQGNFISD
jgi:hypothetical protein